MSSPLAVTAVALAVAWFVVKTAVWLHAALSKEDEP